MPTITVNPAITADTSNPFFLITGLAGDVIGTPSSTNFVLQNASPNEQYQVTGTGFTYTAGYPTNGIINTLAYSLNGELQVTITDMQAPVALVVLYFLNGQWNALREVVWGGADHIIGSDVVGPFGVWGDTLAGWGGDDVIDGGAGNDVLYGEQSPLYPGSTGGAAGNDTLNGGAGNDQLYGGDGNDTLNGGDGLDLLDGGQGADTLDGGAGSDSAQILRNTSLLSFTIDTTAMASSVGTTLIDGTVIRNVEGLDFTGGAGNDTLIVTSMPTGGIGAFRGGGGVNHIEVDLSNLSAAFAFAFNGTDTSGSFMNASFEGLSFSGVSYIVVATGSGNDTLIGVLGADTLSGNAGDDTIYGRGGNDQIRGGAGNDTLNGEAGDDVIHGEYMPVNGVWDYVSTGSDVINGGVGNDILIGGLGNDTLNGGDGDDKLIAGLGFASENLSLVWGVYVGDNGTDTLDGGAGVDSALLDLRFATQAVTFTLTDVSSVTQIMVGGVAHGSVVNSERIQMLTGSGSDTILIATSGDAFLKGNDGDDVLTGGAGNDTLFGDAGVDTLTGGDGDDYISGGAGADILSGGAGGFDAVGYELSAAGVTVNLQTNSVSGGDATGDVISGFERVFGSGSADTITGNGATNWLFGYGGDDVIWGGGEVDFVYGGAGNDTMFVDIGDVVSGESGDDDYRILTAGPITLIEEEGGGGADRVEVMVGNSFTLSDNIEILVFSGISDFVGTGNASNNQIVGGAFNDTLTGLAGNDFLSGGDGDDILIGSSGADSLIGGAGSDIASYATASAGVIASLANPASNTGDAAGDTYSSIENLAGSIFNDTLAGDGGANVLTGGVGYDTLIGNDGADTLTGGADDDYIRGGVGADILSGGAGAGDVVSYEFSSAGVTVNLQTNSVSGGDATGDVISGFEWVYGSEHADTLTGDAAINYLAGRGGDDIISGGAGSDQMFGGDGNDTLFVDVGDVVFGEKGDDDYRILTNIGPVSLFEHVGEGDADRVEVMVGNSFTLPDNIEILVFSGSGAFTGTGNASNNQIVGAAGNDTLRGLDGDDTLSGGAGADSLDGGAGVDTASYAASSAGVSVNLTTGVVSGGDAAGDTLIGIENLTGSAFNDLLSGNAGANALSGGNGDDTLYADSLDTLVSGGAGVDWVYYTDNGNVSLNAGTNGVEVVLSGGGNDTLNGATQTAVFSVYAGAGADAITGGSNNDNLYGQDGNDTIVGGAGNDLIWGEGGADSLSGGDNDDTLIADALDTLVSGGAGLDWVYYVGPGNVTLDAGANGVEVVVLTDANGNDTMNAATQTAVFTVYAAGGNDAITGGSNNDNLYGQEGNDTIVGGAGNDVIWGEGGADSLSGGADDDTLIADSTDTLVSGGAGTNDWVYFIDGGNVVLDAGANGVEVVFTNGGDDVLNAATQVNNFAAYAGGGADTITGGAGNDGLFGQDGNDIIVGGLGNDVLLGENGNDRLTGGGGGDILAGGAGADTFVFAAGWGGDSVLDFQNGVDLFDFTALAGNGVHAFSDLGVGVSGADALITWNSDLIVVANSAGQIDASDFLFA